MNGPISFHSTHNHRPRVRAHLSRLPRMLSPLLTSQWPLRTTRRRQKEQFGASGVAILEDFGLLCIVLVRVTVGSIFVDNLPQVSSFGERVSAVSNAAAVRC